MSHAEQKDSTAVLALAALGVVAYRRRLGAETLFDHLNVGGQFDIRHELVRQVARMTDRRTEVTSLMQSVLHHFGIEDASLMAENMVIAGRSMGLGSCFLGFAMYDADRIAKQYSLPQRVFPLVQLAMGYPAEDPPPRP